MNACGMIFRFNNNQVPAVSIESIFVTFEAAVSTAKFQFRGTEVQTNRETGPALFRALRGRTSVSWRAGMYASRLRWISVPLCLCSSQVDPHFRAICPGRSIDTPAAAAAGVVGLVFGPAQYPGSERFQDASNSPERAP